MNIPSVKLMESVVYNTYYSFACPGRRMDYSDFPSEERKEVLKGLREEYEIELSREDFNKLLKGRILELPPQLTKIERMVVKNPATASDFRSRNKDWKNRSTDPPVFRVFPSLC